MNGKVLLVDDNETILEVLGDLLEAEGYGYLKCRNGAEAVRAIRKEIYSAAIIDINLGDMHGLEILDEVRGRNQFTQSYILTGEPSMHMLSEFIEHGAMDFFAKSRMNTEYILKILQQGFERQEHWKSLFSLFGKTMHEE